MRYWDEGHILPDNYTETSKIQNLFFILHGRHLRCIDVEAIDIGCS